LPQRLLFSDVPMLFLVDLDKPNNTMELRKKYHRFLRTIHDLVDE
jgi:hypothetical protein